MIGRSFRAVSNRTVAASTLIAFCMMTFWGNGSAAEELVGRSSDDVPGIRLDNLSITESSGLAASNRRPSRFWTHNDSGDGPRLFAFDSQGRRTGECRLPPAQSIDWEDMSSYVDGETPRLAVADCGDNDAKRNSIDIYFFDEPDPDKQSVVRSFTRMTLTYADGPRDCEAIAIDAVRKQLILVSKSALPLAAVYLVDLPNRDLVQCEVTATRQSTLFLPMLTSMDMDATNGDIWIGNYLTLFHYPCSDRHALLSEQLGRLPNQYDMPRLRQIEALTVDRDQRVWVTTEGSPALMAEVVLGTEVHDRAAK